MCSILHLKAFNSTDVINAIKEEKICFVATFIKNDNFGGKQILLANNLLKNKSWA